MSKHGESEVNTLCNQIIKLQKQILEYAAEIFNILIQDIVLTTSIIAKLKKQYAAIQEFEFKVSDSFGGLELKYS